jgi:ribosome biogenesis protein Tsr3
MRLPECSWRHVVLLCSSRVSPTPNHLYPVMIADNEVGYCKVLGMTRSKLRKSAIW